jgi:hypothetical protein
VEHVGIDLHQKHSEICGDLRRNGLTIRSPIDCCIAQLAIENDPQEVPAESLSSSCSAFRPPCQKIWRPSKSLDTLPLSEAA